MKISSVIEDVLNLTQTA